MKHKIIAASAVSVITMLALSAAEVRVALIGSSACQAYNTNHPELIWGWGEVIGKFFKPEVNILNFAISGYSSKSFIDRGKWKKTIDSKPHYVFITIGANDSKKSPDRYTDPETTYRANINKFIRETRAIGATPVIVTINQSMWRNKETNKAYFRDGKAFRKDREPYSKVLRDIAKKENLVCIDLAKIQQQKMEAMGEAAAGSLYRVRDLEKRILDPSHTNLKGALFIARIIVDELEKSNSPLKKELLPADKRSEIEKQLLAAPAPAAAKK